MQKQQIQAKLSPDQQAALQKAFATFQKQSALLEQSHLDLQRKLDEAQLSLAEKNRELAKRIQEIELIKERLSGVLSSITDAVFLIDDKGAIHLTNKAAEDFANTVLKTEKSLYTIPEIATHLNAKEHTQDIEIEIPINDDHRVFLLSVVPMSEDIQEQNFKVISLKDITEHRQLQERLKREDRLASLGKVAASVAHEIRNPLGAIEGFARLLERDLKDTPNLQRLASKTVYGARQLNSVVNNLLNYTRQVKPGKEKSNINAIIQDALDFTQPIAEDRKIVLDTDLEDDHVISEVNALQLKQVITNLLLNAIDACTIVQNGHIKISSKLTEQKVVIEVLDNGGGILSENKEKIFDPFFTMKEGGVGLGLALCRKTIESHDGTISESGVPGEGAHFTIKLNKADLTGGTGA